MVDYWFLCGYYSLLFTAASSNGLLFHANAVLLLRAVIFLSYRIDNIISIDIVWTGVRIINRNSNFSLLIWILVSFGFVFFLFIRKEVVNVIYLTRYLYTTAISTNIAYYYNQYRSKKPAPISYSLRPLIFPLLFDVRTRKLNFLHTGSLLFNNSYYFINNEMCCFELYRCCRPKLIVTSKMFYIFFLLLCRDITWCYE